MLKLLEVSSNDAYPVAVAYYHGIPLEDVLKVYAIFRGGIMTNKLLVVAEERGVFQFDTMIPVDQFSFEYGT